MLERKLVNKKKKFYVKYRNWEGTGKTYIEESNLCSEYERHWHSCPIMGEPEIGDRIYGMFSRLAGVRDYSNVKGPKPKGFPKDASREAILGYTIIVDDDMAKRYEETAGRTTRAVTEERAKKWIENGSSKEMMIEWGYGGDKQKQYKRCVTDPDAHSASWSSRKEVEKAFDRLYKTNYNGKTILTGDYTYYKGLIALMKAFEDGGDYEVRMVYWFDN